MSTATARTLPTPPPVPSYQPVSPSKKDPALKPNPHPYAIKTTSTALLTRSNSSGYNVNATHHYYIPTSPNNSRSDSGKVHRPTRSLNSVPESPGREAPRPLPIPPELDNTQARRDGNAGSGGYVSADEVVSKAPRRPRRSETLPIISLPSPALSAPPSIDDLPENPKMWTPSQLATYLTTALRMTSGGKTGDIEPIGLPALVAKDIATFVKSARIGGRTFLRLNEEDLESLGMNKKWRDALLVAARNLRQNVLKGRIWGGDPSPISSPSPSFAPAPFSVLQPNPSPSSSPTREQSVLYSNPTFNSSSSSVDSAASFSTGDDEGAAGGAALGRSKAKRYRNGRVRGMVETFERSGSFSSDGGFEDEAAPSTSAERDRTSARKEIRELAELQAQLTGQRVVESPSPSPSKRRPLPVPPSPSGSASNTLLDEEPTMEALLAELAKQPSVTGARAWEEVDLANGVTVKRVPAHEATLGQKTIQGLGSGRSSGGSSNGKGGERRVVTAIFAPHAHTPDPPPAPVPLRPLDPTAIAGLNALAESASMPTPPPDGQPSPSPSPSKSASRPLPEPPADAGAELEMEMGPELEMADDEAIQLERMLEEEILATRALVDTFRARLEVVEQKVADLEAREALRAAAECELELELERAEAQALLSTPSKAQSQSQSHSQSHSQSQARDQAAAASAARASEARVSSSVEIGVQAQSDSERGGAAHVHVRVAVAEAAVQSDGDPGPQAQRQPHPSSVSLTAPSAAAEPQPQRQFMPGADDPELVGHRADTGDEGQKPEEEEELPAHLSDLPSYVFLAGLGVCAVVTQVVVRRVFGKGMWRP
ncbi:hypothetical protein LXA43DRAFT_972705 [Ganoderma leucocontextum]|nr:hypothetical protein LXA43DRAFT_972705 [Ganoderma leucocontextum]